MFVEHRSISVRSDGDEPRFDQLVAPLRQQHLSVTRSPPTLPSLHLLLVSFSCVLQVLALLQDRQSNQSQSTSSNTPLTNDERMVESQALSNLKKAVEKQSGHFFGSRQQVSASTEKKRTNSMRRGGGRGRRARATRFRLNRHDDTLKGIMSICFPANPHQTGVQRHQAVRMRGDGSVQLHMRTFRAGMVPPAGATERFRTIFRRCVMIVRRETSVVVSLKGT